MENVQTTYLKIFITFRCTFFKLYQLMFNCLPPLLFCWQFFSHNIKLFTNCFLNNTNFFGKKSIKGKLQVATNIGSSFSSELLEACSPNKLDLKVMHACMCIHTHACTCVQTNHTFSWIWSLNSAFRACSSFTVDSWSWYISCNFNLSSLISSCSWI